MVLLDSVTEPDQLERGLALAAQQRFPEALTALLEHARAQPSDVRGHLAIYEVGQLAGRPDLALKHQIEAIALAPIHAARATEREEYALLVPCVAGTWTANTPVELLFDTRRVTIHRWYVDVAAAPLQFPRHDAVFVAIGESDASRPILERLPALIPAGVPVINEPAEILAMDRRTIGERLHDIPGCRSVPTRRVARAELAALELAEAPQIVRPVDSHGGRALERIATATERDAYLAASNEEAFYLADFIDYASGDGYFRKHRIIFVDGAAYAFHLAISPRWMVHYYNAPMTEHAWMRAEEAAFLGDVHTVYDGPRAEALKAIAQKVRLPYFGIDSAVDRDGNVVVFEADNSLIVHALDDPVMFPYKRPAYERITRAVDTMVRKRIGKA